MQTKKIQKKIGASQNTQSEIKKGIVFSIQDIIVKVNYMTWKDEIILVGKSLLGTKVTCRITDIYNSINFILDSYESKKRINIFLEKLNNVMVQYYNAFISKTSEYDKKRIRRILSIIKDEKTMFAVKNGSNYQQYEVSEYQFYNPQRFFSLKVYVMDSSMIDDIKIFLENNRLIAEQLSLLLDFKDKLVDVFGEKIGLADKCIIEYAIQPERWYKLGEKYKLINSNKSTNCDLEVVCSYENIETFDLDLLGIDKNYQASKLIMVYDIECCKSDDSPDFVNPLIDPIIMIGLKISVVGKTFVVRDGKYVIDDTSNTCIDIGLCFGSCDDNLPLHSDTQVVTFDREIEMLEYFFKLVKDYKIDMLVGYNNNDFDDVYVLKRAKFLGIDENFLKFGFIVYDFVYLKTIKRQQKTFGNKVLETLVMPGMLSMDLMLIEALKSKSGRYISLGFLSFNTLGITKEEMDYKLIPSYYQSHEGRTKLMSYCMQDVECTYKVLILKRYISSLIEESRTKISSITKLLKNGISSQIGIVIESFMYQNNILVMSRSLNLDTLVYYGGLCLNPKIGLHSKKDEIILAEDFNSLYPSIMIGNNMGPDTLLFYRDIIKYYPNWKRGEDYLQIGNYEFISGSILQIKYSDNDCVFVTCKHKYSIFTKFLQKFLDMRAKVRKEISSIEEQIRSGKLETSQITTLNVIRDTLNHSQLSYKLAANGTYGFLGSLYSDKSNKFVASAITKEGRNMLTIVQWATTNIYIPNGCYPFSNLIKSIPVIIYGDTDSVFIKITYISEEVKNMMEISFIIGSHISVMISTLFREPNYLALEKNFGSCMLFSKKKYSSLKYELDTKKDIFELIRQSIQEINSKNFDCDALYHDIHEAYPTLYTKKNKLTPSNSPKLGLEIFTSQEKYFELDTKKINKYSSLLLCDYKKIISMNDVLYGECKGDEKIYNELELGNAIDYQTFIPINANDFDKKNVFMWDERVLFLLIKKIKYQVKIDHKGIDVVRSGGCKFISNLQSSILKTLLSDNGMNKNERVKEIKNMISNNVHNIKSNKIPINEFIESRKIQKNIESINKGGNNSFKNENQSQVQLAIKLYKRTKTKISIGSLIHYVIINDTSGNYAKKIISKCAEDPSYVFDKSLQINNEYYIEKLKSMLMRTIMPLFTDKFVKFVNVYAPKLEKSLLITENNDIKKEHYNKITSLINESLMSMKIVKKYDDLKNNQFFKVIPKCVLCKVKNSNQNSHYCQECSLLNEHKSKYENTNNDKQLKRITKHDVYQKICNKCQNLPAENTNTIICINVTCNTFWPRKILGKKISSHIDNENKYKIDCVNTIQNVTNDMEDVCENVFRAPQNKKRPNTFDDN